MENWTNLDKGREGVKNPGNFADIICTWPLIDAYVVDAEQTMKPRIHVATV